MKIIMRLEEAGIFLLSFYLSILLGFDWWLFILFLFAPDLSMLGYVFGNRIGSAIYNVVHFRLLAVLIGIAGYYFSVPVLTLIGLILFGHSSLDRIFGFGLRYPENFRSTHLGWIGKTDNTEQNRTIGSHDHHIH
jgi:hypothetical protein